MCFCARRGDTIRTLKKDGRDYIVECGKLINNHGKKDKRTKEFKASSDINIERNISDEHLTRKEKKRFYFSCKYRIQYREKGTQ